ncbi:ABC transporter ATP-binding protein [Candidatus Woesearchaeota archaeon]|nr:ABC transporter ATP-binding protein [Candidatus Woesearchaeota archaeon]
MENAIEIKNVGKKYNITHQKGGYVSLRDVIMNILKSPFKHAKQKARKVIGKDAKEEFWALKGVSLTVKKGEVIGIIGANGAGKSTLLKVLSQITPPTEGEIILNGRIASLLEIGTGFHQELTGRENVFLNGAILGMTKKEITERFDDIVEFSGVKKFIDTPVKRYSSGMYVKLAFAVAAHMEPDILIVDEVLAVGDAEFRKKSLGKLDEVSKTEGRTILFVSHNMAMVEDLCNRSILLEHGKVKLIGETKKVIGEYLSKSNEKNRAIHNFRIDQHRDNQVTKISLLNDRNEPTSNFDSTKQFTVDIEYLVKQEVKGTMLSFLIYTADGNKLIHSDSFNYSGVIPESLEAGNHKTKITIPANLLNAGDYYIETIIRIPGFSSLDHRENIQFSISGENSLQGDVYGKNYEGILSIPLEHKTEEIK